MLKPYICEVDLLNAQGIVQKVESTATLLIACAKVVILFITLLRVIGNHDLNFELRTGSVY